MTHLSINVNKIALLRNSRGRNYPDVYAFVERCLSLGAHGITLHPRPDQRHARFDDIQPLRDICNRHNKELNIEGFPSREFLDAVIHTRPMQCTLVPDAPGQLTSDHGWSLQGQQDQLRNAIRELKSAGVRVSLFMDFDSVDIHVAKAIGADRIELYTEPYALSYSTADQQNILDKFAAAAQTAQQSGLGVNAGHDLNLDNLGPFLTINNILEVSIGHAFVVECIEHGVEYVIRKYLSIVER